MLSPAKDLSVILCTWNNARRLRITLDAISQCDVPDMLDWELVLVNNNCTDETDRVAEEFSGRLPLRYIHQPKPGLSNARNAGLAHASGRLVLFTDDDVRPYPGWIAAYWQAYQAMPEGFYFGGPVESEFEGERPPEDLLKLAPWSVRGLDWGGTARRATRGERFISANWACPREVILAVGGFDTQLGLNPGSGKVRTGEELDLMDRLQEAGLQPWYLPEARIRHFVPMNKCSIDHLAARKAATGYNRIRFGDVPIEGFCVGGVPVRWYAAYAYRWLECLTTRLTGQDWHQVYIKVAQARGRIEAARDRYREQQVTRLELK